MMAHWAEIDENNIVIRVTVGDNNDSNGDEGYQWLIDNLGGTWIKTSYNTRGGIHQNNNTPLRKNFAGIGSTYDPIRDAFISPQPFLSWVLNEDTCQWEAPTPRPTDGKDYFWDEATLTWVELPTITGGTS
jgi:hypothetical protein